MIKSAWTVAVGNIDLKIKECKEAVKLISEQEGFIGFHLAYPDGTLCLFEKESDAIRARNVLEAEGAVCGKNICHVSIDTTDE